MDGVGLTSLWVAAMRAVETERADPLVRDPFARALAGERGFELLERGRATTMVDLPVIPLRTKWIDDRVIASAHEQIVILAAGMDARAYRLELGGKKVFEVDRDFVLAYKRERLSADAKPTCERVEVPIDLRDDWPSALVGRGFDPKEPALFLVEGLVVYLREPDVRALFARLDALAASGSEVLFDTNNAALLDSPLMTARLDFVRGLGAPWQFGNDDPAACFAGLAGWRAAAEETADVGIAHGRWPFPPAPKDMPGIPRSWFVHATKSLL